MGGKDNPILPDIHIPLLPEGTSDIPQTLVEVYLAHPMDDVRSIHKAIQRLPALSRDEINTPEGDQKVGENVWNRVYTTDDIIQSIRQHLLHEIAGTLTVDEVDGVVDMSLFSDENETIPTDLLAQRLVIEQEKYSHFPVLDGACELLHNFLKEKCDESAEVSGYSARAFKAATSHVAAELAAWLYFYSTDEGDREEMHKWLSRFALVSDTLIGVQTNASLMALNPDLWEPALTEGVRVSVSAHEEHELEQVLGNMFIDSDEHFQVEPVQYLNNSSYLRCGNVLLHYSRLHMTYK